MIVLIVLPSVEMLSEPTDRDPEYCSKKCTMCKKDNLTVEILAQYCKSGQAHLDSRCGCCPTCYVGRNQTVIDGGADIPA
ncbi:Uncharacterised protein g4766 [Pycnogonum litorale]